MSGQWQEYPRSPLLRSCHPNLDENVVIAMIQWSRYDMDVREGRYDAYPHRSNGVGVGGLPRLPHGRNVITGPVAGERRHRPFGIVLVLFLDVLPDGALAASPQFP